MEETVTETCTACKRPVEVMAFKGTGFCGANCASTTPPTEPVVAEAECST